MEVAVVNPVFVRISLRRSSEQEVNVIPVIAILVTVEVAPGLIEVTEPENVTEVDGYVVDVIADEMS